MKFMRINFGRFSYRFTVSQKPKTDKLFMFSASNKDNSEHETRPISTV